MYQKTVLSHTDAMTIINAIRERAEADSLGLVAAVVDDHGELLAFLRTDGGPLPSIMIAQNKAYTAVRERTESRKLGQRSKDEGFPMTNFGELRYVTWGGGVPIEHEGAVIGAVGVSGLSEDEDVALAKAGIAALG
jgi:glc operon protein GlcG